MIRAIAPADRQAWQRLFTAYGIFYETQFTDDVIAAVWTLLLESGSRIARTHGPFCFRHSGITQAIGSIDGDLRIAYHFLPQLGLLLDEVRTLCG